MPHRLAAPLGDVLGYAFAQPELPVGLGQPEQARIGGDAPAVEGGLKLERGGFKTEGGCGRIGHEGASFFGQFWSN